ncbi:hypothetical protein NC652_026983 [Populus alba x Populus x berolinensis]|nr:hypothetical protein NC652_026983 [Populus alba x Populus x berolinensis]
MTVIQAQVQVMIFLAFLVFSNIISMINMPIFV